MDGLDYLRQSVEEDEDREGNEGRGGCVAETVDRTADLGARAGVDDVLNGGSRGWERTVEGQLGFVPPRRRKLGVGLMKREKSLEVGMSV